MTSFCCRALLVLCAATAAGAGVSDMRVKNGEYTGPAVNFPAGTLTVEGASVGAGVSNGDKGDITVSAGGGTWNIDSGAVNFSELAGTATWAQVSKTGSSLADLETRVFSDLQSKPTTLAGYGIVDAQGLDSDLTIYAGITPPATIQTFLGSASQSAARDNLGASSGIWPVALGGNGTATPALVAGSNVTITGTWPALTIAASAGGGGSGITSVDATVPSWLAVAGVPITTAGTIAITAATGQTANRVLATPNGSTGAVSLRALVLGDLPAINFTNLAGSVAAGQMPALTGEVITSAGAVATTIANNAVTNAKAAQMAANTLKGNNTGSTANALDLTVAQAKTLLGLTGTNSGDQTITLTGDVTGSGTGSFAATLGSNVVTNAKSAQMGANTIKGNNTGSTANAVDLTVAQTKTLLNLTGTNSGDQTISDATISTTDITTNNVSTSKHGFAPKAPNDATKYLDGTGLYSVPAGTGGGGGNVATDTIWDAKGDFVVGSGANTAIRKAIGADGTVPIASASATGGFDWGTLTLDNITDALDATKKLAFNVALFPTATTYTLTPANGSSVTVLPALSAAGTFATGISSAGVVTTGSTDLIVTAKTANYSILTTEKLVLFTNTGAAGTVNLTLPVAASGLQYSFYVDAAQSLTVTARSSTSIRIAGSVSGAAGNITSSTPGNYVLLKAISTTKWVALGHEGTWTVSP